MSPATLASPIRPATERMEAALDSLANLSVPDAEPATLEEYDRGADRAAEIAGFALALLTAARELVADRDKFRSDFVSDLAEAASLARDPEAHYGVAGQFRVGA